MQMKRILVISSMCISLIGQLTPTNSDTTVCKMRRQNYPGGIDETSSGLTFEVDDISSSIECAAVTLQHSSSTLGFFYEKLTSVCKGK